MAQASGEIEVGIVGKWLGNESQAIIDVAKEAAELKLVAVNREDGLIAVRSDQNVELRDLEQYADVPRRKRGVYRPATVDAFVAYAKEHELEDATTMWVHPDQPRILAIFDDLSAGAPAWREHQALLELGFTDEWKRWAKLDDQLVDQQAFAEHIEESQLDIVKPDAAVVLEIAESFQASVSGSFKQAQRLANGQVHFEWVENVDAKAGDRGEIEIPKQLELSIRPFLGEEPVALTALLRYRVRDGQLKIGYKLVRPADVIRFALDVIRERLADEFPRVYLGQPAA
jgi:uncharacterized protein YfdQ (DUF2303 family)